MGSRAYNSRLRVQTLVVPGVGNMHRAEGSSVS